MSLSKQKTADDSKKALALLHEGLPLGYLDHNVAEAVRYYDRVMG